MMPCKLTVPTFAVTAAILGGIALAVSTCQSNGAVIDLFDDEPILRDPRLLHTGPTVHSTVLDSGLFDSRRIEISGTSSSLSVANSALHYYTDEIGRGSGYLELIYTSDRPVDLLGNNATAFRLSFEHMSTSVMLVSLSITTPDSIDSHSLLHGDRFIASDPGPQILDIPFSSFDRVDLQEVTGVTLAGRRIAQGSSFELSSITTIPEPGLPLLGTISLFVFARHRRRKPPITNNQ